MEKEIYYHRKLEGPVQAALAQFPAVLITGPRQAGKSTLLQHSLKGYDYVTLDDAETRQMALEDPKLFLSTHTAPLIIDEIQYAPDLLSYLKVAIDADRHRMGQFVLTGSQTIQLMKGVTETLAGRVAIFNLYPFNWDEVEGVPGLQGSALDDNAMARQTIQGFYPEFFRQPNLNWNQWYSSYLTTYLERDVRNLKAIQDLDRFQTFISLLAARAGNLLNLSEVAKECGVSQPTAKSWLSVLSATYVIYLLKPYYRNRSKRLVKSPKLYFVDTGLLCYLLGIDTEQRFFRASERGAVFENMVVMDAIKQLALSDRRLVPYFYRVSGGTEVDLLIEHGNDLYAYEIKLSKSVNSKMASSLTRFEKDHPNATCRVLCLHEKSFPLTRTITAEHWSNAI